MQTCFVIQPFGLGKFNKRFDDVFKPAIEAAGLEAYRVDRDPSVEIPIGAIEEGIRRAALCLADITNDNPNVWYELGFAFASGRQVVMVCSNERLHAKFPFDIQHRTVLQYVNESSSDFDNLRDKITEKIEAFLKKIDTLQQIAQTEMIAPVEGLSQPEMAVLATIAGSIIEPSDAIALHFVRADVERAGLTPLAISLGLRRLNRNGFIEIGNRHDGDGDVYSTVRIAEGGWAWLEDNENKFVTRRPTPNKTRATYNTDDLPTVPINDDDVPF